MLGRGPFLALMVTAAAATGFTTLRHYHGGFAALAQTETPSVPAAEPPVPAEPQPSAAPEPPPAIQAAPEAETPDDISPTAATPEPKPEPAPAAPPPAAAADKTKPPKGQADAAKYLFAAKKLPSLGEAMAIGYYPRGCLAGAVALPINGPHWQVMRLSRNRNWGHPSLVRFIKNFSARAAKATGWNGVLIGDMSQPRGGPTPTGHMSHQTGLDVDVWFVPMPKETLTPEQREEMSANNLVADDWKHVDPKVYTPQHAAFIKAAAVAPEVERVLVNAAIKKKLCESVSGDRGWLAKVRPWYGHHDHIHVRLRCPPGDELCKKQPPIGGTEGCADSDFKFWFTKALEPKKPSPKPPKSLKLADLPAQCKAVLDAPAASAAAAQAR